MCDWTGLYPGTDRLLEHRWAVLIIFGILRAALGWGSILLPLYIKVLKTTEVIIFLVNRPYNVQKWTSARHLSIQCLVQKYTHICTDPLHTNTMCTVSVHICVYRAEAIMQQYVHHQLTNFASQRLCKTRQSARASLPWAKDSKLWKGFVFKGFHQSFIFFLWTWKHNT